MTDSLFYIYVIIGTIGYWSLLYAILHLIFKKKRPIYKLFPFWSFALASTPVLYIIGVFIFIEITFGTWDNTDGDIEYGNKVLCGSADHIISTDWITLYDNQTFHMIAYDIETNGFYTISKDTIHLEYSDEYNSDDSLPSIYFRKERSLYGYRLVNSSIDSSSQHYLFIYNCDHNNQSIPR